MSNIRFINPEQATRCLKLAWLAERTAKNGTRVPTLFIGGPGTAKTSIHRAVAKELNVDLWTTVLSRMEPGDFNVPVPDGDKVKYLVPAYLPFDDPKSLGIMFLEEFDRATPEMQNAALQILLDREFHGHTLNNGVFVSAACNGASDLYTTGMSEASVTRVCSLFVSMHSDGADASWEAWAEAHQILPEVMAFRKYNRDFVKCHDDNFNEVAVCNDRTVAMASAIMNATATAKFQTDDILPAMLAGVVGEAASNRMLAFKRLREQLPTPEEIWRDPENARVPDEAGALAMASTIVARESAPDMGHADAAVRWAVRLPPESAAYLLKLLSQKQPKVVTCPAFKTWRQAHQAILI